MRRFWYLIIFFTIPLRAMEKEEPVVQLGTLKEFSCCAPTSIGGMSKRVCDNMRTASSDDKKEAFWCGMLALMSCEFPVVFSSLWWGPAAVSIGQGCATASVVGAVVGPPLACCLCASCVCLQYRGYQNSKKGEN